MRRVQASWHLACAWWVLPWFSACYEVRPAERLPSVTQPSERDGGESSNEGAGELAQHEKCALGVSAYPAEPELVWDAPNRPALDRWTDFACDAPVNLQEAECDDENHCPFEGECLRPPGEPDGWCIGQEAGEVPLGQQHDPCVRAVGAREKAYLCCASSYSSLDCRPWPFTGTSGPGEVCARHDDCEPGLLCRNGPFVESDAQAARLHHWGRCLCPGVLPSEVQFPNTCSVYSYDGDGP